MDFTLGLITGVYAVIAVIVFYVVYIIEVRLDLPAIVNGNTTVAQSAAINTPNNNNNNNNNNDNNRNEFSNVSETRLRQLIEAIIAETIRLPALSSAAVSEVTLDTRHNETPLSNGLRHRTEHYFKPKIYQDLLATAVLNKIVDKQSNARRMSDSTPNLNIRDLDTSSGSSMEPHSDCSDTENMLNQMVKTENASAGGSSRNLHSRDRSTKLTAGRESVLSDYIASHMVPLPDLSAPATESEEEYASVASSTVGDGNWEDNWLFKKKRSTLSAPVASGTGMLVPAPKEDVRAQIGDKTADEVSDLSEMGSDTDDSSLNLLRNKQDPLNDRLLNKHLIGGQNTKLVLDELIDRASMISSTSPYENEPAYTETKNEHVVDMASKTEAFNASVTKSHAEEADGADSLSLSTNFEDTTESTELSTSNPLTENITLTHVEINTAHSLQNNRFVNDLLKRPTTIALSNATINTTNSTTNTTLTNGGFTNGSATNGDDDAQSIADNSDVEDGDIALLRRFLPGSIAEREYKKWNNAVEMPNNPYAPDALKRRISGSRERFIDLPNISPSTEQNPIILRSNGDEQNADESSRESVNRRYSRDYYINDAKQSAASPKRQLALETLANSNSDEPTTENITINEVIPNGIKTHSPSRTDHSDCHWTLSTPVRRSSSLKFINNRHSQNSPPYNFTTTPPPNFKLHQPSAQPRAATSASHYADEDDDDDNDEDDVRSQRSWQSASPHFASALHKRGRTLSSLSFNSSDSPGAAGAAKKRSLPHAKVLSQFEKQLLHKDLKRNSFRAVSATTKDFVMNPLFDADQFYGADGRPKLSVKIDGDDQVDSGVDSCMTAFSEADAKTSSNSLLF